MLSQRKERRAEQRNAAVDRKAHSGGPEVAEISTAQTITAKVECKGLQALTRIIVPKL